ncbi:PREDICTED: progesterone receptor isoform X1 [Odobenus rosmarus divergens]|uniref:Progesterone receptor n=1 Tax=Odobenus rosmarus divergens TaxID=9708 RepID=A0A2U3WLH5_ODORO|nr:PREDICTED: progesterone receptor isoform X1 [Odobenus rosmarus divergens]
MTEPKAKDSQAPHVAGGAPTPVGSPLSGRRDAGSFQASQTSDASPVVSAIPISLDGLLFPRPCQGQNADGKTQDQQPLSDVEGAYPRVEATSGAGADSSRPPEKDRGLLDSVLDTLLEPAGPGQSHASPPACESTSPWCLFGSKLPEEPRVAPTTQGASSPLMSRPESKAGDSSGRATAHKVLPRGLSPSRQLLPLTSGNPLWRGAAVKPAPQPAVVDVEEEDGFESEGSVGPLLKGRSRPLGGTVAAGGAAATAPGVATGGVTLVPKEDSRFLAPKVSLAEQDAPAAPGCSPLATTMMDFIHVPILPLNSAFLAARTRQLLEGENYDGGAAAVSAFAPPRGSPSASSTQVAASDFSDCAYPPDAEPRDDGFPLYGDFQPPALKIKEEEEGTEAAVRSPRQYLVAGPNPAVFPDLPLALQPLPPRAPSSRPTEAAVAAAAPASASVSSVSSSGSTLECILYKAEGAPPQQGPFAPPPCKAPGAGACLLPRDGASTSASAVAAGAAPALYPQLSLNGLPQLGYQAAVLKEGLPQVYQPYLNYLRPDSDASQSPQYSFESLPQKICLICGDEASGCHYGVLTCGSCKVFFKRAMEGQHNYLCAGRNDCIVDKIRRKNCPACRLRKCCQAGMVLGGRKFKKFNKVRVMRALDAVALPQPVGIPNESQALSQRISFSPSQDIQLIPPLINLLMSIEPDVIYAGHDNTKPDTSSSLLTSLNQLGERQLLSVVKWSKSLPGFRNLHIDDQITLIQYSWMSLMVFGLGWRSYKHVSGQMLYFAPDLILNEQRMKESSFYSLCLTMWQIPQEFVKLQVSQEEFLCMKVLLLLNTIPLEGLRSQNQFEEMRSSYIRELIKAIGLRQKGVVSSSQRFYQLTKLLDNLHDLVKQLHLYCLNTFIQSRALSVEFPEMMSEVIAAQLPKILAGMVKPLLFHKK